VTAFNGLTDAEAERLALLAEEAAEVVHAVGKILRHGYDSTNPDVDQEVSNRSKLTEECGDFLAAMRLATEAQDFDEDDVRSYMATKLRKIGRYLHHQPESQEKKP
jgi:NTP pyrophosphatase (non-canonical NTP hydrolase)